MKQLLIMGGLVLSASLVPVQAIAATFSQIVVYGDSLSDLGRAAAATTSLATPTGAAPPYSALTGGKFSNGPLWVEYLATQLGLTTNPATNFAIGGATTGPINTLSPFFPVSFFPNAGNLVGVQTEIANTATTDPAFGDPDALYIVWAGANDYLSATPTNIPVPTVTIGNLAMAIETLIGRGAKNILVPNLPNLGALPSTDDDLTISGLLNGLTLVHNTGLAATINNLSQLNSSVKLNLLDVNSLFNDVVANVTNPSKFGITNVTDQCLTPTSICSNPSTYLFWDDIHPTTAAHQQIGNLAFSTVSPTAVPEPTSILGSVVAIGSIVTLKRKLKSSQKAKKLVTASV
jgi:thermolabile hemolysin